jgi:hypothetical protein
MCLVARNGHPEPQNGPVFASATTVQEVAIDTEGERARGRNMPHVDFSTSTDNLCDPKAQLVAKG